jgi:hypothetical protein
MGDQRRRQGFQQTMQALIHHPDAGLLAACGSRADAQAAYRLIGFLGESRKAMGEILRVHRAATHARMTAHGGTILAVHDTTSLNYASRKKWRAWAITASARADSTCI